MKPYLAARLRGAAGRQGARDLAGAHERDPQGVALHQLRLLRLGVQLDGVRPGVPRAAGAREGDALRRRPARRARRSSGSRPYNGEHGIWDCTRCYFCNERCPKGVDPRDAIAKLGAESMKRGDRPRHGREAREVVRHLGEDDRLAARDRARAEDAGHRLGDQADRSSRWASRKHGKVPLPFPPHVAEDVKESRALYDLVKTQGRDGALGIVQGERALARLEHGTATASDPYGEARSRAVPPGGRAVARPATADAGQAADAGRATPDDARARRQSVKKVAYYKGCLASLSAKELDISTQALAPKVGLELDRARVGHVLRRRRHPRGRARLLPAPERADPRLRRGDGRRHADDGLQRLHAQPAAGELPAARATTALRARVNENLVAVGVPRVRAATSTCGTSSGWSPRARATSC